MRRARLLQFGFLLVTGTLALVTLPCLGCEGVRSIHSEPEQDLLGSVAPSTVELCCGELQDFHVSANHDVSSYSFWVHEVDDELELLQEGRRLEVGALIGRDAEQGLTVRTTACDVESAKILIRIVAPSPTRINDPFQILELTVTMNCQSPVPRIVFSRGENNSSEIYTVGVGVAAETFVPESETRVTRNDWQDSDPAWSPDRMQIAYLSNEYEKRAPYTELYVMNADSSNRTRLTSFASDGIWVDDPAWSPSRDQRKIAFALRGSGSAGIYVYDFSTEASYPITSGPDDVAPTWSPDGTRIVFEREGDLYEVADQPNLPTPIPLVTGPEVDGAPSWSGTGEILFVRDIGLSVLHSDASIDPITGTGVAATPDWSPGVAGQPPRRFVYVFVSTNTRGLFVIDLDRTVAIGALGLGVDPDWGFPPP